MENEFPWDEAPESSTNQAAELPLFDKSDNLFKSVNIDYRKNANMHFGMDKFFIFSDSYKTAAEELYKKFVGDLFYANTFCYPYIYLNRHFLELRLKELSIGLSYVSKQEYVFPKSLGSHMLTPLWHKFIECSKQIENYNLDSNDLIIVEQLLAEFDKVDPKSFSFRYPVDKEGNDSLVFSNLDIENFMLTMRKLYNFFDTESSKVSYFVEMMEDYINTMASEYNSYMSSIY